MGREPAATIAQSLQRSLSEIDRALADFSSSALSFSADNGELQTKYANKWIAVYRGKVEAVANTLDALARAVEKKHLPAAETLFRHIDREEKILIL